MPACTLILQEYGVTKEMLVVCGKSGRMRQEDDMAGLFRKIKFGYALGDFWQSQVGREKKHGISLLLFVATLSLCLSYASFARDTVSTITSVRIVVDESLRKIEAGEIPSLNASSFSVGDTEKYEVADVQWYDNNISDSLQVGVAPRIIVYLNTGYKEKNNGDIVDYRFSGAYTASNVRVSGGTFISAKHNNYSELEVVIELKGAGGEYSSPESPQWGQGVLGQATWIPPLNTSGYYLVTLLRDGSKVVSITTNAISLDLYPWMTSEGDYTFSVVTVPYDETQKKYGKKSAESESEVQQITESNRSGGVGKYDTTQISEENAMRAKQWLQNTSAGGSTGGASTGGNAAGSAGNSSSTVDPATAVGWYRVGNTWYFRYPNGQPAVSGWLRWKDRWYHFDSQGRMETGWFKNQYGKSFYLDTESGYMKTGWQQINGSWYYFNPMEDDTQGAMFQNTFGRVGQDYYYFDDQGRMKTGWAGIRDNTGTEQYYYFYDNGKMAYNTTINGFDVDQNGRWVH